MRTGEPVRTTALYVPVKNVDDTAVGSPDSVQIVPFEESTFFKI